MTDPTDPTSAPITIPGDSRGDWKLYRERRYFGIEYELATPADLAKAGFVRVTGGAEATDKDLADLYGNTIYSAPSYCRFRNARRALYESGRASRDAEINEWRGKAAALAVQVLEAREQVESLRGELERVAGELTELRNSIPRLSGSEPHVAAIERLREERYQARRVVGLLVDWSNEYGAALIPRSADTYGEGVRACKEQVKRILATGAAKEPNR